MKKRLNQDIQQTNNMYFNNLQTRNPHSTSLKIGKIYMYGCYLTSDTLFDCSIQTFEFKFIVKNLTNEVSKLTFTNYLKRNIY